MATAKLTLKQLRFVEEYLVSLNATQAAIAAGYSPRTAYRTGADNLRKPQIAAAIENAMAERSARTLVSADQVIKALVNIAFSDRSRIATWGPGGIVFRNSSELTDGEKQLVESFSETRTRNGGTIRVELCSRLGAIKMLAEHVGLLGEADKLRREIEELKRLVHTGRRLS
jgi:phage terminase small subunit